ncbi:10023_t:CDS:2 [Rhizophagus irregularis]|nr:10023_t:CDS:2 [Rhizophagus irregularis]
MLENRYLLNIIPIFNEDDENIYTYISPNDSNEKSRIDYIWALLLILGQSINSAVIENYHFTTDYNTVILSLDTQLFIEKALLKVNKSKKKITCTIFLYDEMDVKIMSLHGITSMLDCLRQIIMKSAKKHIKNKNVMKNKLKNAPEKKLAVYFD